MLHSYLFATGSFSNLRVPLHFYLLTELMVRFVQNVHILQLCVYLPSEHWRRPKSAFWVCNSSYNIFKTDHCILLCLSPHTVTSRADIFQQQKKGHVPSSDPSRAHSWIKHWLDKSVSTQQIYRSEQLFPINTVIPEVNLTSSLPHANQAQECVPNNGNRWDERTLVCAITEMVISFPGHAKLFVDFLPPIPPRASVASSHAMQLIFQTDFIPNYTWRNDVCLCLPLADIRGVMIQKERCQDYDEQNQ